MQHGRYLFVDFDSLLASVKTHIRLQSAQFHAQHLSETPQLNAPKLTALLTGQDAPVMCHRGTYCSLSTDEQKAFTSAGWDLRKKSAPEHRTLENWLKRNLSEVGACEGRQRKTLVLATGLATGSVLKCLDAYFLANWRVQLYYLRRSGTQTSERLRALHPSSFQSVYLDRFMRNLVTEDPPLASSPLAALSNQEEEVQSCDGSVVTQPNSETPEDCQRFVLMDVDSVTETLFKSDTLYQNVSGATSARDVRLDYQALTERTCGSNPLHVQKQVAAYCKTKSFLAQGLLGHGWVLKKRSVSDGMALHLESLAQLTSSPPVALARKILVLVMGDRTLDTNVKASYRGLLGMLLSQQWCVEVHAWQDSLGDVFLSLQEVYPKLMRIKPLDDSIHELVYIKQSETNSGLPGTPDTDARSSATTVARCSEVAEMTGSSATTAGSPELTRLQQQMQEMQAAFAALQADAISQSAKTLSHDTDRRFQLQEEHFTRQLYEQQVAFDTERKQFAQQSRDARLQQQQALQEREELLTCPITQCLYEVPVMTLCCGKTFSKAALDALQGRDRSCPWCRQQRGFTTHLNRDMALLVQQYQAECEALGMQKA